jgi:hypothetical protein
MGWVWKFSWSEEDAFTIINDAVRVAGVMMPFGPPMAAEVTQLEVIRVAAKEVNIVVTSRGKVRAIRVMGSTVEVNLD